MSCCCTGCHVVAPSDMMDDRVGAIKKLLADNELGSKVKSCHHPGLEC